MFMKYLYDYILQWLLIENLVFTLKVNLIILIKKNILKKY